MVLKPALCAFPGSAYEDCSCAATIAEDDDRDLQMRCQRCGTQMEMRDPTPGPPWKPDQFWVCPRCGRHFWTTHPAAAAPRQKGGQKPLKSGDSGGAPNLVNFLTSLSEVPTLTPFSSSACGRHWPPARESWVHRQVVGACQQFSGRLLRPGSPAQLVEAPEMSRGPFIGGHGYADRDHRSPSDRQGVRIHPR